MELKKLMEHIS
ncbi:H repeat-associated protein yhhI, partial [Escherichia coli EC1863]